MINKEEFITSRTQIISKMIENPDGNGIFPTTVCYAELDDLYDQVVSPLPTIQSEAQKLRDAQLMKAGKIVYVVERTVQYEGTDVIKICESLEKANAEVRLVAEVNLRKGERMKEEFAKETGALRISISDVSWTTIPWRVS